MTDDLGSDRFSIGRWETFLTVAEQYLRVYIKHGRLHRSRISTIVQGNRVEGTRIPSRGSGGNLGEVMGSAPSQFAPQWPSEGQIKLGNHGERDKMLEKRLGRKGKGDQSTCAPVKARKEEQR